MGVFQMKVLSALVLAFLLFGAGSVHAVGESEIASVSAEASVSAVVKEEVKPKEDLTQPKAAKSRLEKVLESKEVEGLSPVNFLQVAIRKAVDNGVPVNTIVLILLFPLVAALIAAARHVVGLQGFGIFTPAIISVAFLATGVAVGLLLFVGILVVATLGRIVIKRLRMPTLPRMALLLWAVSMGILAVVLLSPWLGLKSLVTLSIFPILLLVLLAETFMNVQITTTFKNALRKTLQTLVLALASFFVMSTQSLQEWVLLNPELTVVGVAVLDMFIGRYEGLRLLERWRFRKLMEI